MPINTHSLELELDNSQYAFITNANQTGLNFGSGDFTIEAWVKLESTGTFQDIISKGGSVTRYQLQISNTGRARAQIDDGGTAKSLNGDTPLSTGIWYHVATVRDGNFLRIYLNGAENAAAIDITGYGDLDDTGNNFQIGSTAGGSFADCLVDEARAWNDARSTAEIADNRNKQLVGNEPGLVGNWRFNNDYLDLTSNNNDLTPSGGPVFNVDVPFGKDTGNMFLVM